MDQQSKIYNLLLKKALTLLSKRRYTTLKLRQKLVEYYNRKSAPSAEKNPQLLRQKVPLEVEPALKQVLSRLKELKYLDDTTYTKDFIESRISSRPRGKFLLKRELKNKGIHPELASRIVEETEINEEEIAFEALSKKAKAIERAEPAKRKEKALRFLASRGFSIDAIYKAVDRWYNDFS
jgi:regulatory protein